MAAFPHIYEELHYAKDSFFVFSDFFHFVTGDDFTSLVADGSTTIAVSDAVGGRIALGTAATDNNEVALRTTAEVFLVSDNKPLRYDCRAQYTESNTDDANVLHGFMSALAANALVDDGAGVRTTGNYFVFFKVDGGTTWQVRSRNGTETETNDTGITAGGASFQKFRIEIENEGDGSSNVTARFFIDDQICRDATTQRPICHTILIASSTEMNAGSYVKAGSASAESLVVDYMGGIQKR